MHATNSSLRRGSCGLALSAVALAALVLAGSVSARADDKTAQSKDWSHPDNGTALNSDAFPVFDSYVKISGQAASISGNGDAYARRAQQPESGAFGIEALHYSRDAGNDVSYEIDGKALAGSEDYLGKFKVTKNEVGSFEAGYKKFRTFYDGIGGFFPKNSFWQPLSDQSLTTDRATFWVDANIALPKQPVFHLGYKNSLRDGQKDTTIWGDTDFTGVPIYSQGSLNPISANRKLIPSYIDLNERNQVLEASMKHTVGNTEYELIIERNWTNSDDTRWLNRYPGELKPYPAIPSTPVTLVPPAKANNPQYGFDTQMSKARVMTYTGKFETTLSDKLSFFGGASYQRATADIAGDREIKINLMTKVGLVTTIGGFSTNGRPPYSYKTDFGSTEQTTKTANVGFSFKPDKDLLASVALRVEDQDMSGTNQVTYINNNVNLTTGVVTPIMLAAPNFSALHEKSYTPEFNLRYTGIKNVSFYTTVDYRYAPGDERGTSTGVSPSGNTILPSIASSNDNTKENHGHYKVGFSWQVTPEVALRAEAFYKDHTNKYTDVGSSTDGFIMGYRFHGYKVTAVFKPVPTLAITGRYVGQVGQADTTVDSGASYDSMDAHSHNFGETIDWNPHPQFYVQENLNVVFATIKTAYPRAGGAANDVLRNADNNYWDGNIIAGFVLTKSTDVQLEATTYQSDNYNPAQYVATTPYGASTKEYTVSAGIKTKLDPRVVLHLKIGYADSKCDTTGGNTNFRGPMGLISLDYAL